MSSVRIFVRGALPTANEYIAACNANRHVGNRMKQDAAALVSLFARTQARGVTLTKRVDIVFVWVVPNQKTDKDNIAFGKKFILDALQPLSKRNPYGVGIIQGDGWKHIGDFTDRFRVDPANVGVEIHLQEVEA